MPRSELSIVFCYVYILKSGVSKELYIGITKDLKQRVAKHNKKLNRSTQAYAPWELIYYEAHRSEVDARRREKYLKSTSGNRAIKNMLRDELAMNDLNRKSTAG